jgi:hypothetical protein
LLLVLACRLLQAGIEEQDEDGMIKGLALCAQLAYVQMVKTLKGHMIPRLQKPALSMKYQNERPLERLICSKRFEPRASRENTPHFSRPISEA